MWADPRILQSPVTSPNNPAQNLSSRSHGFGRRGRILNNALYSQPTATQPYKTGLGRVINWDLATLCRISSTLKSCSQFLKTVACISVRWKSGSRLCPRGGGAVEWQSQDIWTSASMQKVIASKCDLQILWAVVNHIRSYSMSCGHTWCVSLFSGWRRQPKDRMHFHYRVRSPHRCCHHLTVCHIPTGAEDMQVEELRKEARAISLDRGPPSENQNWCRRLSLIEQERNVKDVKYYYNV